MIPSREVGDQLLTRIGEVMIELGLVGPDGLPLPFTHVVWPFDTGVPSMISTAPPGQLDEALLRVVVSHMEKRRAEADTEEQEQEHAHSSGCR